ncbi:MAG: molybdopterin-dependent oxidoreductase, partial [Clostridiales Family XIII bacterium]|nr:molybdopterin-dependent oxidoreductase [Clostridiales Family XIII bacterium]
MKLRKMTLNINGVDKMFICDPEKDTLATVLRRIGFTGVKVGCGKGVCGSCSTIVNGKVIRACTWKITSVKEYSEIITIEGIGNGLNPHPLQVAFIENGAVQCGFCSPGFIVSAYQLLKENSSPTREEVRDWFQSHRNICRCTGYKQIVDAVMAAAKVMRGECSIDDIKVKMPEDKNYYGKAVARPAALGKVTGLTDYGDDIELKMPEGTLHAVFVQPKVASHAKILEIDTTAAEAMPGIVKVVTAKDVKGSNRLNFFAFSPRTIPTKQSHILLAEDKIFNYGDVIAMVVATSKSAAREAACLVKFKYEALPEVMNFLDAARPDAIRVHDEHPNIWGMQPTIKGEDTRTIIEKAPHVVSGSFYSQREPHMPIEGDTVQAYFDEDDMLTVHCKAMAIYANIGDIAEATGIPPEKVRVVQNPTGGTFGWGTASATYALAAIASIACDNMPVALSMTYAEFMAISGKRAPSYTNTRLACDENGKILAAEWDNGLDHGAYNELGDDLTTRIARFMYFPYNVPNAAGISRVATTNHSYATAYRGYGSPQAYTASEAMMDIMAEEIGIDPFDFRLANVARPGDINVNGYEFTLYPGVSMMEKMRPIYDAAVARAKAEDAPELRRGVGIAWGGYNVTEGTADQCTVAIELTKNNTFIKYDTWQDQGQGGDIGSLMVTLEALRRAFDGIKVIDKADLKLIQNDSKFCPDHGASASSRSHFMNSIASDGAVKQLKTAMTKPDGSIRTYQEMVDDGIPTKYEFQFLNEQFGTLEDLDPNTGVGNPTPDYTSALFLAEVAVDTTTGKATVLDYHCVDDVGVIGNIAAVNGQAYGGISHSIGFALTENYEDIKKQHNVLAAGIPTIKEIPDNLDVTHIQTPR